MNCVIKFARNPEAMLSMEGSSMETRARNYLLAKRKKAGFRKSALVSQRSSIVYSSRNFSIGGSMISYLSVLGMEKQSVRYFQHQRESCDGIRKHLSQQFNSSRASVEPKIIYNGPVYNNCSFGNVSKNKENLSNVVGKKVFYPLALVRKGASRVKLEVKRKCLKLQKSSD